jgi:toxin ParE1/3/4
MGRIRRRPLAKADLIEMYRRIAQDNPVAANTYLYGLEATLKTLSDRPEIGNARFKNYPDIRVFVFRNHLILYEPLLDPIGIDIIRILHAARDWMTLIDPTA